MNREELRTKADIQQHLRRTLLKSRQKPSNNASSKPKRARLAGEDVANLSGSGSSGSGNSSRASSPNQDGHIADTEDNNDVNEAIPHPVYKKGTKVFEDHAYKVYVKAVSHRQRTQYSLSDHLFTLWLEEKTHSVPLLFDLEFALEQALIQVLDRLKEVYNAQQNQNQIYVTVLEKNILHGLNSGNYSLNTPSKKIVRWVLSMLYNYLKSDQTLRLNNSFKIQIKVLSIRHVRDLQKRRANFRRHIFH